MRVVITGATGFIGRVLCRELHGDYELIALSRDVRKASERVGEYAKAVEWDAKTPGRWVRYVEGAYAVINLAGENVASGLWTKSKRGSILRSRTNATATILKAIGGSQSRPGVFVQGSAVGYYGSRGEEVLDEDSPPGSGFLADVCRKSEAIAATVERFGVRPVLLRTGVVLGHEGGIVPKFAIPFRFFVGGYVGDGRQWLPWISQRDEVLAIRFLVERPDLRGAFNLTSPSPVTMRQFARELGRVLGRPAWTRIPAFAARLALGRMGDETVLVSEKVIPKRLMEAGYQFWHPGLKTALEATVPGERQ